MADKIAFVFPGQGSQSIGMLADLADEFSVVKETFAEASTVLGYDLWEVVQDNPGDKLNQTEYTQPALLTASVAIYRCLNDADRPTIMAGHSLGEYSALVCAGALPFTEAVRLVQKRGQAMQSAVPEGTGAMAAVIGLDDESVEKACAEAAGSDVVAPVNYNSPGQVVIAGETAAVERASEACKAAGAKRVLPLPVSVPSHCALMKPAAEKLAVELEQISLNEPELQVLHNVDVTLATQNSIAEALIKQLYSPVLWTQTVEKMAAEGVTRLYEIGPGKVLTGLAKRIDRNLQAEAINDSASVQKFLQEHSE